MKTTFLSSKDIESIVLEVGIDTLLDQLISTLRNGFSNTDFSKIQTPTRTGLYYTQPDLGLLEWMPAAAHGKASLKIVGYHPSNPAKRALPTILSTLCAFDTNTGHMQGILDGTFATAFRTGAMSAIASAILTPSEQTITLGIIGSGAQAVTQAHALSRVLTIGKILIHDKDPQAAASFKDRISFLSIPVSSLGKDAFNQSLPTLDLLCTCTSEAPGAGSLFADFNSKGSLHINAVGSDFPGKFELPLPLLKRAFVCPDFMKQAFLEGECQQLEESTVDTDLATLLNETKSFQANKRNTLSVFDSTGHSYADFLTADFFLNHARRLNLGRDIELESIPTDPLNPYSFLSAQNLTDRFMPKATFQ